MMVERGPTLLTELVRQRLLDRLIVVLAPKLFGSREAPGLLRELGVAEPDEAPALKNLRSFSWGEDIWIIGDMGGN